MAYCKVRKIKWTLGETLKYCLNLNKLYKNEILYDVNVTPFLCSVDNLEDDFNSLRDIIGSQVKKTALIYYQSFKPGEIDSEKANKIGVETMKKLFGEERQYCVITHIDKEHIHNHILVSKINMNTGMALENNFTEQENFRKASDEVCLENGLSIISRSKGKELYDKIKNRKTKNDLLEEKINMAVKMFISYEDFKKILLKDEIEVIDDDNLLKFKFQDSKKIISKINDKIYYKSTIEELLNQKSLERNVNEKFFGETFNEKLIKKDIKNIIDDSILISKDYEEFKSNIEKENVIVNDDYNFLKFKKPEDKYFKKNIDGELLTKEKILNAIEKKETIFSSRDIYYSPNSNTYKIKKIIDDNILTSKNYKEFIQNLEKENVIINDERKYLRFKFNNEKSKRWLRIGRRINYLDRYSKEGIIDRIKNKDKEIEYQKVYSEAYEKWLLRNNYKKFNDLSIKTLYKDIDNKFNSKRTDTKIDYKKVINNLNSETGFMIDFEKNSKVNLYKGYEIWAIKNNIQTALNSYNNLFEWYNISNIKEIPNILENLQEEIENLYKVRTNLINDNKKLYIESRELFEKKQDTSKNRIDIILEKIKENQKQIEKINEEIKTKKVKNLEIENLNSNIQKWRNQKSRSI